jgi:phosphohistidine phosphatase
MALYLVQHGKSLPKEVDPDPGLSEEGRSEATRIADVARGYQVQVTSILHSGKKRARQTAEIFAAALKPTEGLQERKGLKPLDDVAALAAEIGNHQHLMLVGHLPFMEKLASYLITGSADKRVFKFQNGGIVCLDRDSGDPSWYIKWALMPAID